MGDAFLVQNIKRLEEQTLGLLETDPADSAVQLRDLGYLSGVYWINWGGVAREIYCDMNLEGGGWMMILNYVHLGGTNPGLTVRTTNFPLMGANEYTFGNESASTGAGGSWGHISNSLANAYPWTDYMFYGKTSGHNRIIHFRGNNTNIVNYIKTGSGTMQGYYHLTASNFAGSLAANNPSLPFNLRSGGSRSGFSNEGNFALTNFPIYAANIYTSTNAHWGIRGLGSRWEVDDYPSLEGSSASARSTIHRVWVR
jgi:hypothetical protein